MCIGIRNGHVSRCLRVFSGPHDDQNKQSAAMFWSYGATISSASTPQTESWRSIRQSCRTGAIWRARSAVKMTGKQGFVPGVWWMHDEKSLNWKSVGEHGESVKGCGASAMQDAARSPDSQAGGCVMRHCFPRAEQHKTILLATKSPTTPLQAQGNSKQTSVRSTENYKLLPSYLRTETIDRCVAETITAKSGRVFALASLSNHSDRRQLLGDFGLVKGTRTSPPFEPSIIAVPLARSV